MRYVGKEHDLRQYVKKWIGTTGLINFFIDDYQLFRKNRFSILR